MSEITEKGVIVKGYKATDKDMKCRDYQFELGKWHEHDGDLEMCASGFHFCEYPSGPLCFYGKGRVFHVEAEFVLRGTGPGADLKHVAKRIRLVSEIEVDGERNTGDGNTGRRNTGHRNTGDGNTGDGNTGDHHSGCLNHGEAKFFIFNEPANRDDVAFYLVSRLSQLLMDDDEIDAEEFLSLPNATPERIKALHDAHKAARASLKNK